MPTIDKRGALHAANGQYTFKPGTETTYDLESLTQSLIDSAKDRINYQADQKCCDLCGNISEKGTYVPVQ